MFGPKDWGRKSSTRLSIVRWKGDLVVRGYLTRLKVWGECWLGVLSVVVGVLLRIVVGHDLC